MPEQKAAMAMQRAVMAMAQSDPEPEITKTCTETEDKAAGNPGPAANDRIRRNVMPWNWLCTATWETSVLPGYTEMNRKPMCSFGCADGCCV